ncbi:cation:proton antiporter [Marinobacter sp.]|uniref:cation:proton antiporter n=1 Tax=Marinobacter sp. TaxID=50741 RepID=UPI003B530310
MEHALHLLLIILAARLFGEAAVRLRQPALVGEIVAGMGLALLASTFAGIPALARLPDSPFLEIAAEFGIFFLLLYAGMEMRPAELAKNSGTSLAVAFGGMIVPLLAGFALAWVFLPETPFRSAQSLLVGVALSISAVPVTARLFQELGLLHERVGRTVMSAAIFDDVFGLVLMAVLVAIIESGDTLGMQATFWLLAQVGAFFAITITIGVYAYPLLGRLMGRFRIPAFQLSSLLVLALAYSMIAEAMGMDFILGPFMAGLFFDRKVIGKQQYAETRASVSALTDGLLGPLFFASIGVRLDLDAVVAIPGFLAALLLVAFLGKLLGAGIPARLAGLSNREAATVGIGLSGRGAVELIIASIALEAGLLDQPDTIVSNLFSAIVIVAVITTLVTPIVLRWMLGKHEHPG